MDKIILKNLAFYGFHGVLPEEQHLGQKFYLDIILRVDLRNAGTSDDIADTVHYGEVYHCVRQIVEHRRYRLLEALAEAIATEIFQHFERVADMTVCVRKPEAPIPGIFDYVGVEIRRTRDG